MGKIQNVFLAYSICKSVGYLGFCVFLHAPELSLIKQPSVWTLMVIMAEGKCSGESDSSNWRLPLNSDIESLHTSLPFYEAHYSTCADGNPEVTINTANDYHTMLVTFQPILLSPTNAKVQV